MKRYLVFCGSRYYPIGGMLDFFGAFPSIKEAQQWYESNMPREDHSYWCHVYDAVNARIVCEISDHYEFWHHPYNDDCGEAVKPFKEEGE